MAGGRGGAHVRQGTPQLSGGNSVK